MSTTKFHIKNMVCNRCKMAVKAELQQIGLHPVTVELGYAEVEENVSSAQYEQLSRKLNELGFELLDNKRSQLIEQIKNEIVKTVHYSDEQLKVNFSHHLATHLNRDYSYLSKLFSEVEGITIEKYFINQKIERAKELLAYNELILSEIANKLGYSSVAHLSAQFKKVTGLTPSFFKSMALEGRKPLDEV